MHRLRLGLLVAALLSTTVTAQPARFAVAIVRYDGHLIPFAAYEKGSWVTAWDEAGGIFSELPHYTVKDVPSIWQRRSEAVPLRWRVFPETGEPPIAVQVTGVDNVPADSEYQWALSTNFPARGKKEEAELALGIATNAETPITRVEQVKDADVAWMTALDVVKKHYDRLESAEAAKQHEHLIAERPAIRLTELYREVSSRSSFLYFVAERQYQVGCAQGHEICPELTTITGWLRPDKATFAVVSPTVYLDDRYAESLRPMGAIHIGPKTFWVGELHGYEHSADVVTEVSRDRARLVLRL